MAAPHMTPAPAGSAQLSRRRRPRALLSLAAALALAAAALPSSAAQAAAGDGHYVLQRNAGSTALNNIMELVHEGNDGSNPRVLMAFPPITNTSDWTLDMWDTNTAALESAVHQIPSAPTYLDLDVRLGGSIDVKTLNFERNGAWSFGPTLVFTDASLGGFKALNTLYVLLLCGCFFLHGLCGRVGCMCGRKQRLVVDLGLSDLTF